ncbi:MAG TPA: hypothetical protein VLJ76_12140, partial [Gaiellaceae bacterium]|nr:hypothetical protein [Gaiellaceae bacterium]
MIAATITAAAATAAAMAAATTPTRVVSAPPCTPKLAKINGHEAAVNCGPATATLHIGGKTYTFRNGFCEQSKVAGAALELNLGTIVTGVKNNAGKSYFTITIGSVHSTAAVGRADYGGKDLLGSATPLINVKGSIPAKGTFT